MSRLGAAVNFITTDGVGGRYGILASAVCSVTDNPPTIIVCVNRSSGANATIKRNGVLCVNILSEHQQDMCSQFMKDDHGERFALGKWTDLETGAPALVDATASIDCSIDSICEVGSHSVFFAQVLGLHVHEAASGLIWFDRRYHNLR
ncbi:flavin reductase [Sphingobium lactosutens]|nr:flavin reductase [Sphingobium lactosutens]